jgi:hypothetical protein
MKRVILLGFLITSISFYSQIKSSGLVLLDNAMSVKLDLDNQNSKVYLTLSGPSDRWFALGFNSTTMGTQTIDVDCVVMTSATNLTDSYIQHRSTPQADGTNNWTLIENSVSNTTRTIKAYRDFVSNDNTDFTFTSALTTLDIIWAYSYFQDNFDLTGHGEDNRGAASLSFSDLNTNQYNTTSYVLNLFPNPVVDELTILPNNITFPEIEIKIYNSNFQLVFSKIYTTQNLKEIKIPFTSFSDGVYFVKSKIDTFESFKKIVVKR